MASTYVNNLRLNEMATGDGSGTWGTTTNTNLELIADAFGYGTEGIITNADTHTTTIADGAADEGRAFYVKYTGTLDSACTITIGPNTIKKVWIIENATSGSQNIIMKQGTGGTVTIGNGNVAVIYGDGAGAGAAMTDAFADLELSSTLTVAGNVDFNGALDVDGTTNLDAVDIDGAVQIDSTVTVGVDDTGYDVKFFGDTASAYMLWDTSTDDLVLAGAAGIDLAGDLDVDGTTNLDAVDIDGAVQVDSTITVGADDTGYDVKFFGDTASAYMLWDTSADDLVLAGAAGIDLAGDLDVDGTANLDVVDIDGAVDMASTLTLAGNADFNGDLDVDGTTNLDVVDIDGAVDMASTLAVAGVLTGASLDISGNIDIDGTSNLDVVDIDGAVDMASTLTLAGNADFNGDLDVDGTTNLDVVDIDGAVDMASTLTVAGVLTGASLDISGDIDIDGTSNLDVVDIDGAVDMASTLTLAGNADFNGDLDVDGTTNLDVVDIDGAVDMASTLTVHSNVSMTVADNSAGLQVICTDADASAGPLILLDRDTASPADGDTLGRIYNQGRNDADELITYAQITTKSNDVTDGTEDGEMLINVMTNGSATSVMSITGAEIQMDATAVDLNGTLDVSGTSTLTGAVTTGADLTIPATNKIYLDGGGNTYIRESSADTITFTTENSDNFAFASDGGNPSIQILANAGGATGTVEYSEGGTQFWQHGVRGADEKWYLTGNATLHSSYALMISGQDVTVGGALSKGSGSFKIDHPLSSMKDTHDLVHSFIEGPRADLIYRGSVELVAGYVQVDLDEAAGMTEGTWELLCRDPQCWIQNDSGWAAVRGSVEGGVLTIDCADTDSVDTVSWMVVAERQDEHMMETNWTDSNGRVIVEPEKPEEVEDL